MTPAAAVRKARPKGNTRPTEVSAAQVDVGLDVAMEQVAVAKRISHAARPAVVGHSTAPAAAGWGFAWSIRSAGTRAHIRQSSAAEARVLAEVAAGCKID